MASLYTCKCVGKLKSALTLIKSGDTFWSSHSILRAYKLYGLNPFLNTRSLLNFSYLVCNFSFYAQREGKGTSSQVWCLPPDQLSLNQPTHNPPLTSNPSHHIVNTLKEWKFSLSQPVKCQWLRKKKKEARVIGNERRREIENSGLVWMSWRDRKKSIWQKREN